MGFLPSIQLLTHHIILRYKINLVSHDNNPNRNSKFPPFHLIKTEKKKNQKFPPFPPFHCRHPLPPSRDAAPPLPDRHPSRQRRRHSTQTSKFSLFHPIKTKKNYQKGRPVSPHSTADIRPFPGRDTAIPPPVSSEKFCD
jgi:hypothetical protein